MKKISTLLICAILALTSCSSDSVQGPPGQQGPPGADGIDGLGYTFEETITFDYFFDSNTYSKFIAIPDAVATVNPDADAVLVYRLEIVEDSSGNDLDTWSLIPQNFFLEEGIIQYVYNHTALDVEVIIDGNFDLSNLEDFFVVNQTFRIVVVPSDTFAEDTGVDVSNINAVMKALNIQESEVIMSK